MASSSSSCTDDSSEFEKRKENIDIYTTTTPKSLHYLICKSFFCIKRFYLPMPRIKETFPLGCSSTHAFIIAKDLTGVFHLFMLNLTSKLETPSDFLLRGEIDGYRSPWEKWPENFLDFLCGCVWKDQTLIISSNSTSTTIVIINAAWRVIVKTKLPPIQKVLSLTFNDNFVVIIYLNVSGDPNIIIVYVSENIWSQKSLEETITSVELSEDDYLIISSSISTNVYHLEFLPSEENRIGMIWKHAFKIAFKDGLPPYLVRYYPNERALLAASTRGIHYQENSTNVYDHKNHNSIISAIIVSHTENIILCHDISNGLIFYKKDAKISTFSSDSLNLPSLILKFSIPRAKYRYSSLSMLSDHTIGVLLPDGTFTTLEIR